ncbi:hypothetical protein DTO280E4_8324 [Paecilomyces variotii]|nr:hypothetical protein DTO280E4_8324 [Paecilomyces variotii]
MRRGYHVKGQRINRASEHSSLYQHSGKGHLHLRVFLLPDPSWFMRPSNSTTAGTRCLSGPTGPCALSGWNTVVSECRCPSCPRPNAEIIPSSIARITRYGRYTLAFYRAPRTNRRKYHATRTVTGHVSHPS